MITTIDSIIDDILRREDSRVNPSGVNVKADKGGPTYRGVTLTAFREWRQNVNLTAYDMEVALRNDAELRDLYRQLYIVRPGFSRIETTPYVLALLADCSVNHGRANAAKLLQRSVHVFPDGVCGQKTIDAANRITPRVLYYTLCGERTKFYGSIITSDPTQAKFAEGWAARNAEFIQQVTP